MGARGTARPAGAVRMYRPHYALPLRATSAAPGVRQALEIGSTGSIAGPAAVIRPGNRPCLCGTHHSEDAPELGTPLDPDTCDHAGAVLWNNHASELWRYFTTTKSYGAEALRVCQRSIRRLASSFSALPAAGGRLSSVAIRSGASSTLSAATFSSTRHLLGSWDRADVLALGQQPNHSDLGGRGVGGRGMRRVEGGRRRALHHFVDTAVPPARSPPCPITFTPTTRSPFSPGSTLRPRLTNPSSPRSWRPTTPTRRRCINGDEDADGPVDGGVGGDGVA